MSRFLLAGLAGFFGFAFGILAAPKPPNDDFADRIVLQGNSVAFSGTLAGATHEPSEAYGGNTVWWSWTAAETSPVMIEFLDVRRATPFNSNDYTWFNIYNPTNLALGFPTNDFPVKLVAQIVFLPDNVHPTLTFTGYAGQTYQFQLMGGTISADYEMRLTATNNPIILQDPRTTSAAEHENVLFAVAAIGAMPLGYQWFMGGAPIMGENGPTLMITNVSAGNAGDYSVVLSNGFGMSTGAVAHLFVSAIPQAPRMDAIGLAGTNGMNVGFIGEPGRFYQVQTTADFVQWKTETNFLSKHLFDAKPVTSGFVFCSNGAVNVQVTAGMGRQFVRVVRYAPVSEGCMVNLKQFRFLKNLWAMQLNKTYMDTPMDPDIFTLNNVPKPRCPQGGIYTLGSIKDLPRCSVPGHVLEEPQ